MSDTLVIRADATPQIGTGHVMRCIALAQAWMKSGKPVVLIGHVTVPWVRDRLSTEALEVEYLEGEVPAQESPLELLKSVVKYNPTWVVLDGYHFTYACQKHLHDSGYRLLVVDDYNHLPKYCCDILLNQNICAHQYEYAGDVGTKLLGLEYVLFRDEVISAISQARARQRSGFAKKILLTLGGGDATHFIPTARKILEPYAVAGNIVRVVAGGTPVSQWEVLCEGFPVKLEILTHVDNLPEHMLWADFCVTAGGSTCWELSVLGVPFQTVALADNQKDICRFFDAVGRGERTAEQPRIGADGARKIIANMMFTPFVVESAKARHSKGVYDIASSSETRKYSLSTKCFSFAEHSRWYSARIASEIPFYVLTKGDIVLGYIRFDQAESEYFVSIAMSKEIQGKGLGFKFLKESLTCFLVGKGDKAVLKAIVKDENACSLVIFKKAGFLFEKALESGFKQLRYAE